MYRTLLISMLGLGAFLTPAECLAQVEMIKYGPHSQNWAWVLHAPAWAPGVQQAPPPVYVHFHGGGFTGGSPEFGPFWWDLYRQGVTIVAPTYRLIQHKATKEAILRDGARVVQYLRLNSSRLDIDPHRIAIGGYSSGGLVGTWVGLREDFADPNSLDPVLRQSSRVSAICAYDAQIHPMLLSQWERYTGAPRYLLKDTVYAYVRQSLNGRQFTLPFLPTDFNSPADFELALLYYDLETNPFKHCSADDPAIFFLSSGVPDPQTYLKNWSNTTGLHSPLLMIPMKNRMEELHVRTGWGNSAAAANFILQELQASR